MKNNTKDSLLTLDSYLNDPCRMLSIPYFKHIKNPYPKNIMIKHELDLDSEEIQDYQPFFRLSHDLKNLIKPHLCYTVVEVDLLKDMNQVVTFINDSYPDLQVDEAYIHNLKEEPTYRKDLWIWLENNGERVALAINCYDAIAQEGTLEWIQVKSEHRGQGYGLELVLNALVRLKKYANFVTVSGQVDNKTNPELLYRKAGFTGSDIWYIKYI